MYSFNSDWIFNVPPIVASTLKSWTLLVATFIVEVRLKTLFAEVAVKVSGKNSFFGGEGGGKT